MPFLKNVCPISRGTVHTGGRDGLHYRPITAHAAEPNDSAGGLVRGGGRWGGRREQERPGRKVCRSAWHVRCVTLQRRRDRYIAAGDGPERSSSADPSPPHHDT